MRVFDARYWGRCHECGQGIEPGDPVAYADDELVHEDCHPDLVED